MIEFKGDCGHTIRAKDEDAGKVVRCSYCGREAPVPDEREDQLDFLLNEVERTGEFESPRRKGGGKPKPTLGAAARARSRSEFNPFAVALKMCYAAIIITVLIVAGKQVYKQLIDVDRSARTAEAGKDDGGTSDGAPAPKGPTRRGLLWPKLAPQGAGIFFNSVPPQAQVYVGKLGAGSDGSIFKNPIKKGPTGRPIALQPACYEVAVSFRVADPQLMALPGYPEARHDFGDLDAKEEDKIKVLEEYFLPDRRQRIALQRLSDFSHVIVRYYEVEVVRESWVAETALFLPRELELAELMAYLPKEKVYGFDDEEIRVELQFRQVPEGDWQYISDALSQVGMLPYHLDAERRRTKTPSYRLFVLGVTDGRIDSTMVVH